MMLVLELGFFFGLMGISRSQCELETVYFCSAIPNDYPENLESILFLQKNIGVINSTVFRSPNLKSVMNLTLAKSGITRIEPGAFYAFQGLTNLRLYENNLTWLSPSWLSNPALLNNLSMSGNDLQEIRPSMMSGFTNLKMLNFTRNKIHRITSGSFSDLPMDVFIDLSDNKISTLSVNIFGYLKYPKMKLGGNPWNCSCELQEFGVFLQELLNESKLADANRVTCCHPPELKGIPVWNVSYFNCSAFIFSPSLENKFGKIGLPAILTCLALLSFLALFFLCLKKNQETKQVQPEKEQPDLLEVDEKMKVSISIVNPASKAARTKEWIGHQVQTRLEIEAKSKVKTLKGRSKSATAILLKSEFVQIGAGCHMPKADIQEESQGNCPLNEKIHQIQDLDNATELWNFDSLRENYKRTLRNRAEHSALEKTGCLSHDPITQLKELTPYPATQGICLSGPKDSLNSESFEPLLYLSVLTKGENPHVTEDVPKLCMPGKTSLKPLSCRKVLTWPPVKGACGWDQDQNSILPFNDLLKAQMPVSDSPPILFLGNIISNLEDTAEVSDLDLNTLRKPLSTNLGKTGIEERAQGKLILLPKKKTTPEMDMKAASLFSEKNISDSRDLRSRQRRHHTPREVTEEHKIQAETLRDRAGQSGSPADGRLLENNDLLHEVVENHGRWTRERWKQTHQHQIVNQFSLKS
uniref:Uncharacterized protein LOC117368429 n=1 Tax=Geotrypetes seraphini TaxID=260995 RepID=A0A6P8SGF1_GEOSA|nr:uncharacterized protein LOC117368429 [Geotrypetes seraphini]